MTTRDIMFETNVLGIHCMYSIAKKTRLLAFHVGKKEKVFRLIDIVRLLYS